MIAETQRLKFRCFGAEFLFEIDINETIISANVIATGAWEENQLVLYKDLINPNGIFVDVGANIGINSIFARLSNPTARIICVEPEPRNFDILQRNVASISDKRIELNNIAIADREGEIGFAGTGTNAHIATGGAIKVPCVTLDAFVASQKVNKIDLMKIDVEGYTDLVLSVSNDSLAITDNVIIEFSYGDIVSRLRSIGDIYDEFKDVVKHSEELFDILRRNYTYFYYISRREGLIRLHDTSDLFDLIFSEARVGDILATKKAVVDSISSTAFILRSLLELKRQNHFRLVEIQRIDAVISDKA